MNLKRILSSLMMVISFASLASSSIVAASNKSNRKFTPKGAIAAQFKGIKITCPEAGCQKEFAIKNILLVNSGSNVGKLAGVDRTKDLKMLNGVKYLIKCPHCKQRRSFTYNNVKNTFTVNKKTYKKKNTKIQIPNEAGQKQPCHKCGCKRLLKNGMGFLCSNQNCNAPITLGKAYTKVTLPHCIKCHKNNVFLIDPNDTGKGYYCYDCKREF